MAWIGFNSLRDLPYSLGHDRFAPSPGINMLHRLTHDLTSYKLPDVFEFREDTPDENQIEIVSRLIEYYFHMKSECEKTNAPTINGIWENFSKLFVDFESTLNSRNVEVVSEALLNVCKTSLVSGFASYHSYTSIAQDRRARFFEAYLTVDRVLSLAESLGAAFPHSPYQARWGYHDLDLDAVMDSLILRTNIDITPPKAGGGAFGIRVPNGVLSISDVLALYISNRTHTILNDFSNKSVCEIGGGTGTLAFYLSKTCADSVTVADLPIVSIIQGYYLMKSLGPKHVHLYGEPKSSERFKLIPFWELDSIPDKSVSLFINVDSLPEIDEGISRNYMGVIKRKAINGFYSINQEAQVNKQGVVQNLTETAGGFQRIARFPYWMIKGYVEELYKIAS